jgi:hypothetical protein
LILPNGVGSTTAGSDGHAFVNAKPSRDGRKLLGSGMVFLSRRGASLSHLADDFAAAQMR